MNLELANHGREEADALAAEEYAAMIAEESMVAEEKKINSDAEAAQAAAETEQARLDA